MLGSVGRSPHGAPSMSGGGDDMAGLSKREAKAVEPFDPFARFDRLFD